MRSLSEKGGQAQSGDVPTSRSFRVRHHPGEINKVTGRGGLAVSRGHLRLHTSPGSEPAHRIRHSGLMWLGQEAHAAQQVLEARVGARGLFQPRVLRPRLLEDGNVRVGVFPECEEILIGGFGLGHIAGHSVGTAKLKMRK